MTRHRNDDDIPDIDLPEIDPTCRCGTPIVGRPHRLGTAWNCPNPACPTNVRDTWGAAQAHPGWSDVDFGEPA